MTELSVMVQCWAAMAAFRAAVPTRFSEETGWHPDDLAVASDRWRLGCRAAGALLLAGSSALAISVAGLFEGLMIASSATMLASFGVVLLAPVARRIVWGAAAICLALTPVTVVAALMYGGSHGAA